MAAVNHSAALVGCTGLVGSQILTTLTTIPSPPTIHAIARKPLPTDSTTVTPHIESDSSKWPAILQSLSPGPPNMFISALGTTRAQAGSFEAQRKIDYDLNLSLAKAAKDAGTRVYVLISSDGVSKTSMFPYMKIKGELEDAVKGLGFAHTVIVKPGLLVGARQDSRPVEGVLRGVAKGLKSINSGLLADWWAQDADVVAKAAVSAGILCAEGEKEEGVWLVGQSEIIKLGRTEWKREK